MSTPGVILVSQITEIRSPWLFNTFVPVVHPVLLSANFEHIFVSAFQLVLTQKCREPSFWLWVVCSPRSIQSRLKLKVASFHSRRNPSHNFLIFISRRPPALQNPTFLRPNSLLRRRCLTTPASQLQTTRQSLGSSRHCQFLRPVSSLRLRSIAQRSKTDSLCCCVRTPEIPFRKDSIFRSAAVV